MLGGTDIRLLYEWIEYYEVEPFGDRKADIRNAINCLAVMSAAGAKKTGGRRFEIADFMPEINSDKKSESYNANDPKLLQTLERLYGRNRNTRG